MSGATETGHLSAAERSAQLRKAVLASTIGTAFEWYDFILYGTAAGLVFVRLYFPNTDPLTAKLFAFSTIFVAFVARPVGAMIFGHFGDRIGRKAVLVTNLMVMGLATFLIAFIPTYASIGIWGAVILTTLRAVQGIAVGGQWAGSVLLAMEWARHDGQRGLVASWPQLGIPAGLLLANLSIYVFSGMSGDAFLAWGWRIPFMLGILPVAVGLWIGLSVRETPVFRKLLAYNEIERAPLLEVIKWQPKEIILSALLRVAEQASFYIFTAFIFVYAVGILKMPRELIVRAVFVAACVSFITIPLSGYISDRIGRRSMYLIGAAAVGVFSFLYFIILDAAMPSAVFVCIVVSLIPHAMMHGPQAALIAEAFTPRLRYSGSSLGYQLGYVIAGATAPWIAADLFGDYHSGYAIAIYITVCAVISVVSAAFMPDYASKDISAAAYAGLPGRAVTPDVPPPPRPRR
jgi:MFS family permease